MMRLGSTYLIVKDMEKSIRFYEALLDMKVSAQNFNRWAQFNFLGACISLYNPEFDKTLISSGNDISINYSEEYLHYFKTRKIQYGNNFVLNFYIDDLNKEYERLKALNIGPLSPVMYLNIASPYHFFVLDDPDGNTIEVTGSYKTQVL